MWRSLFKSMKNSALKVSSFSPFSALSLHLPRCLIFAMECLCLGHGDISRARAGPSLCLETLSCDSVIQPLPGTPSHQPLKNSSGSGWSEELWVSGICLLLGLPPQPKADRQPPEMAASTSGTTQYLNWWRRGLDSLNSLSNMLCPTSLRWVDLPCLPWDCPVHTWTTTFWRHTQSSDKVEGVGCQC